MRHIQDKNLHCDISMVFKKHLYTERRFYRSSVCIISLKSPHHLLIHFRETVGSTARIGVASCIWRNSRIGRIGVWIAAIVAWNREEKLSLKFAKIATVQFNKAKLATLLWKGGQNRQIDHSTLKIRQNSF